MKPEHYLTVTLLLDRIIRQPTSLVKKKLNKLKNEVELDLISVAQDVSFSVLKSGQNLVEKILLVF